MKKFILGIILSLVMILNTGCEKSPSELISLTLKEGTDHSGVFIFKNESDYDAVYGHYYQIMKKENDKWVNVEMINKLYVTSEAFNLSSNQSVELSIDWEYAYGKLPKGLYKIVKEVTVKNKDYDVYGTFNIE